MRVSNNERAERVSSVANFFVAHPSDPITVPDLRDGIAGSASRDTYFRDLQSLCDYGVLKSDDSGAFVACDLEKLRVLGEEPGAVEFIHWLTARTAKPAEPSRPSVATRPLRAIVFQHWAHHFWDRRRARLERHFNVQVVREVNLNRTSSVDLSDCDIVLIFPTSTGSTHAKTASIMAKRAGKPAYHLDAKGGWGKQLPARSLSPLEAAEDEEELEDEEPEQEEVSVEAPPPSSEAPASAPPPDLSEDLEIYKLEVADLNEKLRFSTEALREATESFSKENAKLSSSLRERDNHVLRLNEQLQAERVEKDKALANERLQISKRNEFEGALTSVHRELEAVQAELDAAEENVASLNRKIITL